MKYSSTSHLLKLVLDKWADLVLGKYTIVSSAYILGIIPSMYMQMILV